MKKAELIALGLSEEQAASVLVLHGKGIEVVNVKVTNAEAKVTEANNQLTAANAKIAEFEGMDIEKIKLESADWKQKAETAKTEADAKIAADKFDRDLTKALEAAGVKDPKDVLPHLKKDLLKQDGDNWIGLTEQIKPLQETKSYLFKDVTDDVKIVTGGKSTSVIGDNVVNAAREAAGLEPMKPAGDQSKGK